MSLTLIVEFQNLRNIPKSAHPNVKYITACVPPEMSLFACPGLRVPIASQPGARTAAAAFWTAAATSRTAVAPLQVHRDSRAARL